MPSVSCLSGMKRSLQARKPVSTVPLCSAERVVTEANQIEAADTEPSEGGSQKRISTDLYSDVQVIYVFIK